MSQWCWRCVNLGPNKRFGTDYVIIATNERGRLAQGDVLTLARRDVRRRYGVEHPVTREAR